MTTASSTPTPTVAAPASARSRWSWPRAVHQDRRARLVDVVTASIAIGVTTLASHDPGSRLADDIELVHKARVATRQLRSDLRTFRALMSSSGWRPASPKSVTPTLSWRSCAQAASVPEVDAHPAEALLAQLAAERKEANQRLLTLLDSERYLALLNELTAATPNPPLDPSAIGPGALRARCSHGWFESPGSCCERRSEALGSIRPTKTCTRCERVPKRCATPPRRRRR
jgi:hypothetical protein